MAAWTQTKSIKVASILLLALCLVILLWTAIVPVTDAFRLRERNPNEGWNVVNAQRVNDHLPLYPGPPNWTPVNYPALSFHIFAWLERLTGDYLFTARFTSIASVCLCGIFVGMIVALAGRSRFAGWLAGFFLVALFCADVGGYVGMDDPQILAQVFFLAGLYAYVKGGRKGWSIELTALLFVLGGNIKHNLIEFPLAVLLDLLFSSPRKALRFAAFGLLLVAASVFLTIRIDGPSYVFSMLAPRAYSLYNAHFIPSLVLEPILIPAIVALLMAFRCLRNPSQRVLALLLLIALPVNIAFAGGYGVWINAMFGSLIAIVLLIGIFWAEFPTLPLGPLRRLPLAAVCALFFLSLAIPMNLKFGLGIGSIRRAMQTSRDAESRYATEVAFLRQQPGPALCMSPLRCYSAGKPYIYDGFNAPRWIALGKLDANVIVDHIRNHDYGAVQLNINVEKMLPGCHANPQCVPSILLAVQQYYHPAFQDTGCAIYLPDADDPRKPSSDSSVGQHSPITASSKD